MGAMIGRVRGLPTIVPSRAASRFARTAQASATAAITWTPKSGVKLTKAPRAKPRAMRWGVSGMRRIRWPR